MPTLKDLLACRLIPLDKNPGMRPIGIGEVMPIIIRKALTSCLRSDVINTNSNLQLYTGIRSECEIAVHASVDMFEDEKNHEIPQQMHQICSKV